MSLTIKQVASSSEMNLLENLMQVYEREFSIITNKKPGENGLYPLDVNLKETENFLLLGEVRPIGLCVKGNSGERHDIFEFFVTPEMRGRKIGSEFAKSIFDRYKGPWQVRQIEGADKAKIFWRKTIAEYSQGLFEESVVSDPYWGQVNRQTFTNSK